ncbi:hypothetical protein [Winogradskya consettensis]|nr:hypothetical protein [Actinoplanes consettensis]
MNDEKTRYAIRRRAVELTKRQWLSVAAMLVAGLTTTVVRLIAIPLAAGCIALGATAVLSALIIGFGRHPQRRE